MVLRLLLALAVLLASACTNAANNKPAIDEIERRHTEDIQRMGSADQPTSNAASALAAL